MIGTHRGVLIVFDILEEIGTGIRYCRDLFENLFSLLLVVLSKNFGIIDISTRNMIGHLEKNLKKWFVRA